MAGDGGNDLPIFKLASRTYAPNSGSENVKAQADVIINRDTCGVLTPMLIDAGLL
jgi:hydroxymethylpyrimidine pyrophosphatase-like HAD family hydrolase